jgi:cholesterol oxidase
MDGVIDHRGRVYDLSRSESNAGEFATFPGLFVCDGAIFPTALAANPFFTIAAMAERNADLLVSDPAYSNYFSQMN